MKKRPAFKVGDQVRKIVNDKFKQRANTHKWSKDKFLISKVLQTAPYTFFLSSHGRKSFYTSQLLGEGREEEEVRQGQKPLQLISGILQKKVVPTRFLRSGQARAFEDTYLVTLPNKKRRFMNRTEILKFSNGAELLNKFLSK